MTDEDDTRLATGPLLRVHDVLGQLWTVPPGSALYEDLAALSKTTEFLVAPVELLRTGGSLHSLRHDELVNVSTKATEGGLFAETAWRLGWIMIEVEELTALP